MMMMMVGGERHNPTIQVPPWNTGSLYDEPSSPYSLPVSGIAAANTGGSGGISGEISPYALGEAALAALQRWLPSNNPDDCGDFSPVDAYSCDEFRMYEFKVRRCARGRSHDWTECPYAHPGEKARRRDPRKYHYSGTACPDFRKGGCKRGDSCEFSHGVFECWLHPARYRTQPCKDGTACRRRVCFFAHTPEQLRVIPGNSAQNSPRSQPDSYDGSPLRTHHASLEAYFPQSLFSSSPTSTLISPPGSPPADSPPMSPVGMRRGSLHVGAPVNEVLASLRQLQLSKANSSPSSWGFNGFVSPRGAATTAGAGVAGVRASEFSSSPTTPTRTSMLGSGDGGWIENSGWGTAEEPVVESGRALRAKMFERISKEGGLDCGEANGGATGVGDSGSGPDVGWVSELVK